MSDASAPRGNILMITGSFLIVFGLLALFSPVAAGVTVVKIVALVMLVTGVLRLGQAIKSKRKADTVMSSILGAVITGLGILVWMNPELGSGFLTILLTVFFLFHGVWKISAAFQHRRYSAWRWLLLSAILSLLFAWFMWKQWPLSGAWAVGILVGLDLLLTGVVTIALARAFKRGRAADSLDTISL